MSAQVFTLPVRQSGDAKNGAVPPTRQKNTDVRSREHLTETEVERAGWEYAYGRNRVILGGHLLS
jgi:hypothetical protein